MACRRKKAEPLLLRHHVVTRSRNRPVAQARPPATEKRSTVADATGQRTKTGLVAVSFPPLTGSQMTFRSPVARSRSSAALDRSSNGYAEANLRRRALKRGDSTGRIASGSSRESKAAACNSAAIS